MYSLRNILTVKVAGSAAVISLMGHFFQIDLRFEAKNIERFRENFRNVDHVKFPTPLRPFVTRTILVETFEVSTKSIKTNLNTVNASVRD